MPPVKRRKLAPKVEEVTFDPTARHDFLTGFHKRKLQRTRHAQEVAEKRAREEARLRKKRVRIFGRGPGWDTDLDILDARTADSRVPARR